MRLSSAEFEDNVKGSLEPEKLADVIVLSQDLFRINPHGMGGTRVRLTIVGGKVVYREGI
jgi:predicted amidohydrolase YtcJ